MLRGFLLILFGCGFVLSQNAQRLQQLESEARQALAAHNVADALTKFQEFAKLSPKTASFPDEIGFILAATNRTAEAVSGESFANS